MKKFRFLVGFGLAKRVKTKAFWIANVVLGLIMITLLILPTIISVFSSDETADQTVWVIDNSVDSPDLLEETFITHLNDWLLLVGEENVDVVSKTGAANQAELIDGFFDNHEISALIMIGGNQVSGLTAMVLVNDLSDMTTSVVSMTVRDLNRLAASLVYPELNVGDVSPVFDFGPDASHIPDELAMAIGQILVIPLFLLIQLGFSFIGVDIIEEKSTKSIEIIIASVPPKTHFLSKIGAVGCFILIQFALKIIYALIGLGLNHLIAPGESAQWGQILGPVFNLLVPTLIVTLFTTIFGVLMFLVIGAFMASLATSNEDYQQVQVPLMIITMLGYFIAMMASVMPQSLVQVLSYIPLISPMLLPVAYLLGIVSVVDVVISILILVITLLAVTFVLAPAYRASILSYDQSKVTTRIINSFRQAKEYRKMQKQKSKE